MKKKTFIIFIILILFLLILGIVLYLPAIFQEGNPLPIIKGIVRLQLSDEKLISIYQDRYITRTEGSDDVIISFLDNKGLKFGEQFGSAYILFII
jgi:flagellar basal body-associated protein FliL